MMLMLPDPQERQEGRQAMPPYTSATVFEQFVERVRTRNAPARVDQNLLLDYGIPSGAVPPLLAALRWLGFIDEAGIPTDTFKSLQTPLDEELSKNLRTILEGKYSEVLSRLDMTKDSRDHVKAYFARNHSVALSDKMTTFFVYLAGKAGLEPAAVARRSRQQEASRTGRPASTRAIARERVSNVPVPGIARQEQIGVQGYRVATMGEFWRRYIELLETLQVSLEQPRVAATIVEEKNKLIREAIQQLTEHSDATSTNEGA